MIDILEENSFREVRRKGSHIVLQKRQEGSTITVVVPNHREIRVGTLASIIRQSLLSRSLFEI
ncbi:MAG TPA: type II toxin-antitoxin system HicA family toxin [Acidobacteriota bacterium]|nr:type II toxin-antitoxin system HicA family toxin [Acidobacteriota bacterium]